LGHKVHPTGFRLGVIKGWQSRWYADDKHYKELLSEDFAIRKLINKELFNASLSRIEIERVAGTQITVSIYTAKPGIVIGKSGEKVDRLRATLEKLTGKKVNPKIVEIRTPEIEAILVGKSIAEQLEKRVSFRRAMKQAVQKAMKSGAKGIKVICAGRLGGAEIARSEREVEGSVPLHTLRADIDFAIVEAHTTFGTIGIKVWIYKGIVLAGPRQAALPSGTESSERQPRQDRGDRGPRQDRGDRAPRGPRPDRGDRPARPMGDRPPRPMGDRPPRPMGDRPAMGGDRPPRPMGDRPPRPMGDRPAMGGDRPPRPMGDRPPRPAAGPVVPPATGTETPQQSPTEQQSSNPAPAPQTQPEA